MTPQEIISSVRALINDDSVVMPTRFSDTEMLAFVNQAIKRMVVLRPDLFITSVTLAPTADTTTQAAASTVVRIMEIHNVVGGNAIIEVDKETMDQNYPEWRTEASGTPVNWMRHPRSPRGYFLYPAPSSGVTLASECIQAPADYIVSATIDLPDAYKPALIDCTVFLSEIIDDETVMNERAIKFYNSFLQALGVDQQQRAFVDTDSGLVGAKQQQNSGGNNA